MFIARTCTSTSKFVNSQLCIDYANRGHMVSPYGTKYGRTLTTEQLSFNASMQRQKLAVEHGFMKITQSFRFFQDPTLLKIGQVEVAKMYQLAVFFRNIRTCFDHGNQISDHFGSGVCCRSCSYKNKSMINNK